MTSPMIDKDYTIWGILKESSRKRSGLFHPLILMSCICVYFEGKQRISLWCDGKQPPQSERELSDEDGWRSSKRKKKGKNSRKQWRSKVDECEELENIYSAAKGEA